MVDSKNINHMSHVKKDESRSDVNRGLGVQVGIFVSVPDVIPLTRYWQRSVCKLNAMEQPSSKSSLESVSPVALGIFLVGPVLVVQVDFLLEPPDDLWVEHLLRSAVGTFFWKERACPCFSMGSVLAGLFESESLPKGRRR